MHVTINIQDIANLNIDRLYLLMEKQSDQYNKIMNLSPTFDRKTPTIWKI